MGSEQATKNATTINQRAAAFIIEGQSGAPAFLLLHGLTASPTEVRPLADFLHERFPEASISCPLLPGHGTTPEILRTVGRNLWTSVAQAQWQRLSNMSDKVAVIGVSMGAVLAAHVAASEPGVCSLTMLSPMFTLNPALRASLPWLRFLVPYKMKSRLSIDNHIAKGLFSYDRYPMQSLLELQKLANHTFVKLPSITCPVLMAGGSLDRYMSMASLQKVRKQLSSKQIEIVECSQSGHVLPHEPDANMLFEKIYVHLLSSLQTI